MKKVIILVLVIIAVISIFLVSFWKIFPIKYKSLIVEYSKQFNLQPELVSSLIYAESGFDKDAVSNMGAVGLMQILPSTAEEIAHKLGVKDYDLTSPEDNIRFGCYYLRYLLDIYKGDIVYSLCAYNAGLNNVSYWIFDDIDEIPVEQTRNYVKKIIKCQKIYNVYY